MLWGHQMPGTAQERRDKEVLVNKKRVNLLVRQGKCATFISCLLAGHQDVDTGRVGVHRLLAALPVIRGAAANLPQN